MLLFARGFTPFSHIFSQTMDIRGGKHDFSAKEIQGEGGQVTHAGPQSLRKTKISSSQTGTL